MRLIRSNPRTVAEALVEAADISARSLPGRAALGREFHHRLRQSHPEWEAEASLKAPYQRADGIVLTLAGRADFIRREETRPTIVEAKSIALTPREIESIADPPGQFALQAAIYGWMFLQTRPDEGTPGVELILGDPAGGCERRFPVEWSPSGVEAALERFIAFILLERRRQAAEIRRRRRIARRLVWPFRSKRASQGEIEAEAFAALARSENFLIEAPTGSGKTAAVVFPTLQRSLRGGAPLFYATSKSGGRSPILTLMERFLRQSPDLRVMLVPAKAQLCRAAYKAEACANCSERSETPFDLPTEVVVGGAFDGKILDVERSLGQAQNASVCAYRLNRAAVSLADVVIGDLNYVFDPAVRLPVFGGEDRIEWSLLIDEAHNLPERSREMFSAELSLPSIRRRLDRFLDEAWRFDGGFAENIIIQFGELIEKIETTLGEREGEAEIGPVEPDPDFWREVEGSFLRPAASLILEAAGRLDPEVEEDLWKTCDQLKAMARASASDPSRFLNYFNLRREGIGAGCLDASEELGLTLRRFRSAGAFSATLQPLDYSLRAMGFDPRRTNAVSFEGGPASGENLKTLIARGIDTRFISRSSSARMVSGALCRFAEGSPGGILALFPSFDYITMIESHLAASNARFLVQPPGQSASERERSRREFRDLGRGGLFLIAAGSQFSEAVDFSGDDAVGMAVVGPCLPPPDFWREAQRAYWESAGEDGSLIAYIAPGVRKVVQAAGRIIRSKSDRGVLLLMDDRFLEEPIYPLLPAVWRRSLERCGEDWATEAEEFWSES